jgi:hypothetical protein
VEEGRVELTSAFCASIEEAISRVRSPPAIALSGAGEYEYASKFASWETRSSVRAKPRRIMLSMAEDDESGRVFFPPELVPAVAHPYITPLGSDVSRAILIRRLHTYLDFTAELEQSVVNPIAHRIGRRRSGYDLPERMIADAYKIYTDEAWHAQFSDDLQRQIQEVTHVAPSLPAAARFTQYLTHVESELDHSTADVARMFFAIVSETLISAILSDIPKDPRVVSAVRDVIADHAIDEGRHHSYFSQLVGFVWPQLDARTRTTIGLLLPRLITTFLEPDLHAEACMLAGYGLDTDDLAQVLWDSYHPADTHERVRRSARMTLRHLEGAGVLDDPAIQARFDEAALL